MSEEEFDSVLPLIPNQFGEPCSKEAMAATIVKAAELLDVQIVLMTVSEIIIGHSLLRVTGPNI